jgi:hypothetical protein
MHLQQRQHRRLEQLWVTLLHEEVQLVARVVPQSGKLFRVAQHAPLRKEVEHTPELLLLSAMTHIAAVCLGAQDICNRAPTVALPGLYQYTKRACGIRHLFLNNYSPCSGQHGAVQRPQLAGVITQIDLRRCGVSDAQCGAWHQDLRSRHLRPFKVVLMISA